MRSIFLSALFLLFFAASALGQTYNYVNGTFDITIRAFNPCGATPNNGYLEITVNAADGGMANLIFLDGPGGNDAAGVLIPVGPTNTFTFNGSKTLPAGTYQLIIRDISGNFTINTFIDPSYPPIVLTALPAMSLSQDVLINNSSCSFPTTGQIQSTISGGSKTLVGGGSYTYSWSADNGLAGLPTNVVTNGVAPLDLAAQMGVPGLPGGNYTLSVTDNYSNPTCVVSRVFTLTDPSPAVQTITTTSPLSRCFGDNITITLNNSESGVTYTILRNGTPTVFTFVGTGAGAFPMTFPSASFANNDVIQVRATNGFCSPTTMTGSIVLNIHPLPTATASGGGTVCSGSPLPNVTFTFTGTPPFNFTYTDGTSSFNVVGHNALTFVLSPAPAAGTYSVTALTDANTCAATNFGASATVTVNPSPTSAVLSGSSAICAGGTANLIVTITSGTGPFTINIDNGVGVINNYVSGTPIPVSPAATTTYNMVGNVTDANGCFVAGSGSATVTVNNPPTAAVISGTATICSGTSTNLVVTITGGTSPYTINIDNGVGIINNYVSGTPIPVSPATSTTYSLVGNVTDAAGCTVAGTGTAVVTVNPSPTSAVLSGTTALCAGGSANLIVTITGGTGPYTININNGVGVINNYVSGTPIPVSPAVTTTYNMVGNVTDANGCFVAGTGSATVTVNNPPTAATITGTATICSGTSTNLVVTIIGGTSPYTITINNGVGTINNYVSGTPIPVSPATSTTYNLVGNVTDAAGCTVAGTGSAVVTVNPSPTSAVLSGTASLCSGGSTNLIVTITGGTGPYSINIDNGVGVINNYVSGTPIPVSPAATTTYNLIGNVTDASGCFVAGSGSATVTVNNSPTAAVLTGTATICSGTSTNLVVTITGGTGPYTVTINNGVGTLNNYVSGTPIPVSPATTTAYAIVGNVTDAAGCSVAGTGGATVTVNPSPTSAVLSGTAALCAGGSTNLIVTITGGTSPYTITINNGVGTINNYVSGTPIPVSPAATTTYSMVGNVTDAAGCFVAGTGSATVTVNNPPTAAVLSGTATICSGTSTNLIVTITGGTSPYTVTINNGVGTINNYVSGTPIPVSPAATTTYNIVGNVTDAAGCTVAGTGSATVTVNPSPTSAVLSGTATICSGGSTNLIVTITGGTSPYTVTINNGVGTINNYVSGTPIPVSPAATTSYSIVGNVTDASGCGVAGTGTATVTVNNPPASAVLSGTSAICAGGSANLIVTITGGTSPYTITIDNGVGTINNYVSGTPIPVSPAATTTYNMVGNVTDAAGCSVAGSGSATITVSTPPASAVLTGTATICSGATTNLVVTITGGTGPYTVTINNGVGTLNNYVSGTPIPVSPAATTTYSIVGNVTDAAGCTVAGTGTATVTVNSPTSAVLSGTAVICAGNSTNLVVTITGGTGPYTINIDNGVGVINNYVSGTPIPVSPAATTTYNMVGNVTDANGCTVAGSGTATVTVNTPPASAVLSGTTAICGGGSANLIVTITGGTGPYTINIDNGVGVINNYVSGTPIPVSPAATTTYNMVGNVTDAAGCTVAGSGTATVTVSTPPASAVLTGTATICAGGTTNLIVTITGGTGPYTVTINNGVGTLNNYVSGTPIPVSPAATTTYSIVGNVTDAAGCTVAGTGTATVTVNSPTSAVLSGTAAICAGNSTNLVVTITGGTGPYTINIDNGVGVINNYVSGTPIPVSPAATTTYNMVGNVTDANGCTVAGSGTATVTVNTPPASAVLSGTATICAGGSANLIVTITGGTGPYTINIDNGVGVINNYVSGTPIPVSPAATTTYNMVGNVTDAAGCTVAGTGTATVTVNSPTSAVLSGAATICAGNSTNLIVTITGGTSPYTINIDNGVGVINNYVSGTPIPVSPASTTTYSLVGNVVDANTCSVAGTGTATVTVSTPPSSAVLGGTATICAGTSTNLIVTITDGTGPFTVTIDNGVGTINNYVSGTPIPVSPATTTTYSITGNVTDAAGCTVAGSGTAVVTVNPSPTSAVLTGTATICSGNSTNLVVTIAGGTSPYTITINNGVGTINNYVSGTPIPVSPAATTSYSLVGNVTDASGCGVAGTGNATVTVNPSPTGTISGTAAICSGSSTNITVNFTGTGPWNFQYSDGTTTSAVIPSFFNSITFPVNPTTTTTYTLVSVNDATACPGIPNGSAVVTVNQNPVANLAVAVTLDPVCSGGVSEVTVAGSETGVSYQLRNDSNDSPIGGPVVGTGGTINLGTGVLTATTTFNVLATAAGCTPVELTNKATVNVTGAINAGLTVTALASPICSGASTDIQVFSSENGVLYQLRDNSNDSNIGAAVPGNGGTINLPTGVLTATTTFNILASNGTCFIELTELETVNVDVAPDASLNAGAAPNPLCVGGSANVTVDLSEIGVTYQLRNDFDDSNVGGPVAGNGGTISLPTGTLATTTTFNILATSGGACGSVELASTVTVTVAGAIDASLPVVAVATPICEGSSTSIEVQNSEAGVSYQLRNDFDDSNVGTAVAGNNGTIILSTGALTATTSFNVLATGGASCPAVELTTVVTVTVAGAINNGLDVNASASTICAGGGTFIQVVASEVGVNYQLRNDLDNSPIGTAVAGNNGTISLPTGNLTATTTFNVLASNVTCSIELAELQTVTVNPAPNTTLAVAPAAGLICPNTATFIIVTGAEAGVTYQLRNSAGNVPVGGAVTPAANGNLSLPTGNLIVNTTFNVFATVGSCSAQLAQTASVTIRPVGDPFCGGGGTGQCATVVIRPNPTPATCTLSTGGVTFTVNPFVPLINNEGVIIKIDGTSVTNLNISRTQYNDTTFLNLPMGNYTYSIVYGDSSCIKPGTFTIDQSGTVGTPVASNIVRPVCAGSATGSATIDVAGETGNLLEYSFDGINWTPFVAGAPGAVTDIVAGPAPTFERLISVRRNSSDPCNAAVTIVIQDINPAITATFTLTSATCNTNDGAITNIVPAGGSGGPFQYSLDGVNFQSANSFNSRPGGIDTLIVRDGVGCTVGIPFNISFPGFVDFDYFVENATCDDNGLSGKITVEIPGAGSNTHTVALGTDQSVEPDASEFQTYPGGPGSSLEYPNLAKGQYFVWVKSATAECPTRSPAININGVQAISFDIAYGCSPGVAPNIDEPYIELDNLVVNETVQFEIHIYKSGIKLPEVIQIGATPGDVRLEFDDYSFLQIPGDDYELEIQQLDLTAFCLVISERVPFIVPRRLSAVIGELKESYPDMPTGYMQVRNFDGGMFPPYQIRIELDSASSFELASFETNFEDVQLNSNSQFEKIYKNIPAGRYLVQVQDTVGCFIEKVVRVPLDTDIFIPNIFTPNEDGSNDVFFIRNLPTPGARLIVTNRWGKQVFTSNDYQNDWTAEGVADGIYYYKLQGSDAEVVTGWVEILRGNKP